MIDSLGSELGLSKDEAILYLRVLRKGAIPVSSREQGIRSLLDRGMIIVSGDNKRYVPVHPRLAVANHYRTWRERMVREMNERRMRVDKLILELIPVYEAAREKKLGGEGR